MVRLGPGQTKFSTPYDLPVKWNKDELLRLTEDRLDGANSEVLIAALLPVAHYMVGRYIYYWPVSRSHIDDMLGEAYLAIVLAVKNLNREELKGRDITKLIMRRIQTRVDGMLSKMMDAFSACESTRRKLAKKGGEMPRVVALTSYMREVIPEDHNDIEQMDIKEAVQTMAEDFTVMAEMLRQRNWGLTNSELAETLGIGERTLRRKRRALRDKFKSIGEDNE
jgi:DNA-binding NarL/FixJ family response regulator